MRSWVVLIHNHSLWCVQVKGKGLMETAWLVPPPAEVPELQQAAVPPSMVSTDPGMVKATALLLQSMLSLSATDKSRTLHASSGGTLVTATAGMAEDRGAGSEAGGYCKPHVWLGLGAQESPPATLHGVVDDGSASTAVMSPANMESPEPC